MSRERDKERREVAEQEAGQLSPAEQRLIGCDCAESTTEACSCEFPDQVNDSRVLIAAVRRAHELCLLDEFKAMYRAARKRGDSVSKACADALEWLP